MRFALLGTLRVTPTGGPTVTPKASRATTLLAALLLDANRAVSPRYLDRVTWGAGFVPSTARSSLHTYVSRLRHYLRDVGIDPSIVETVPGGYRIRVAEDELDLLEFTRLVGAAEGCRGSADERPLLDAALALRTEADLLLNVLSDDLREDARRKIDAEWLRAIERHFDLRLAGHDDTGLRAQLQHTAHAYPDHPRFAEQLTELLYRRGEHSEALRTFNAVCAYYKDVLQGEVNPTFHALGIALRTSSTPNATPGSPSPSIQVATPTTPVAAAATGITTNAVAINGMATNSVVASASTGSPSPLCGEHGVGPCTLIGRGDEQAMLTRHLLRRDRSIAVITGVPGVGKTALALSALREVQPYALDYGAVIALRQESGAVRCPHEIRADVAAVLERFAADAPGDVPTILLDDAASAEQVLTLVSSVPGRVVITSRRALAEFVVATGSLMCRLGGLSVADSMELVNDVLGPVRVRAERDAVLDLVELCGRMPMPLLVAAARLSQSPALRIADFVGALRGNPGNGLSAGVSGRLCYGAITEAFFDRLDADLRTGFVTLSRHGGEKFSVDECSAILGTERSEANAMLSRLVDWSLAEEVGPGCFRLDTLLSLLAVKIAVGTAVTSVEDPDVTSQHTAQVGAQVEAGTAVSGDQAG